MPRIRKSDSPRGRLQARSKQDALLPAAECIAVAAAALLIGGCGSVPTRAPVAGDAGVKAKKKPAPVAAAPRAGRGGAYYQDDGPGDNPPAHLDQIADAVPREEPLSRAANKPYTVFGREYVPYQKLTPYRQRGIGSWYGRKFNGQRTSSGEPYDMYAITAAPRQRARPIAPVILAAPAPPQAEPARAIPVD